MAFGFIVEFFGPTLVLGSSATASASGTFSRFPVGVLKLARSSKEIQRLATVNVPVEEGFRDHERTSRSISTCLELIEEGFGDLGGSWNAFVGWTAEYEIEVLLVALYFFDRCTISGSTSVKPLSAACKHSQDVAAVALTDCAELSLDWIQRLFATLFGTQYSIGLIVTHDTVTSVVDEIESGLLTCPCITDVSHNLFHFLGHFPVV